MTLPKKSSSKKRHKKSYDEEADDDDDDGVGHVRAPRDNGGGGGHRTSSKASEFFRLYVLDWRTLAAVFVPAAFCLVFPVYWLLVCPRVWAAYPDLHRPDVWIVAYWVFAAVVWAIFLIICFYRSR